MMRKLLFAAMMIGLGAALSGCMQLGATWALCMEVERFSNRTLMRGTGDYAMYLSLQRDYDPEWEDMLAKYGEPAYIELAEPPFCTMAWPDRGVKASLTRWGTIEVKDKE